MTVETRITHLNEWREGVAATSRSLRLRHRGSGRAIGKLGRRLQSAPEHFGEISRILREGSSVFIGTLVRHGWMTRLI